MKLVRFGDQNKEKPGLLDANGEVRDLSGVIKDVNPDTLDQRTRQSVEAIDPLTLPRVEAGQRLGPCVGRPGKFVCIGLNYHDHAVETGLSPPSEPVVFMKAVSAISGPHDDIALLRGSTKSDWEVELGIVIGKRARYITADQALDAIAGFLSRQ